MVYSMIQVECMESKGHNAVDSIVFQFLAVKFAVEDRPMPRAK
jgi:hypothetical protein